MTAFAGDETPHCIADEALGIPISSTPAFKGQRVFALSFPAKIPCQNEGNVCCFLCFLSSGECGAVQAVCTLKQEKADWDTAKRVLGESSFMKSLLEFDKDHIPEAVMKKLRKYTDNPEFTAEAVAKQSKAAQSLCMWCRAMEVYDRIAKVMPHFTSYLALLVPTTCIPRVWSLFQAHVSIQNHELVRICMIVVM